MTRHPTSLFVSMVLAIVPSITVGALAQQPQPPDRQEQRRDEAERAREARQQARDHAIQQARERAEAARERERQEAQQRETATERSIVLPQDYPRVTGEPVRSGVPMSTYTRMLGDLDPAYRMFAIGQLVQFHTDALKSDEFVTESIVRFLEVLADQDVDPGVRVFALYRLSDFDAERAVHLARGALVEMPRDSNAWRFTLAFLVCAEPDEFMPMVRETLIGADDSSGGHLALWAVSVVQAPFEDFVPMAEAIATERIAQHAAMDRLVSSPHHRVHDPQPSVTYVLSRMERAFVHAISAGKIPESRAEQDLAEAFSKVVRASLESALRDDDARASLLERYLDVQSGDAQWWGSRASTLPEELIKRVNSFAIHLPYQSGTTALTILGALEDAFDGVTVDGSEEERQLLEAMRTALLDRDSWTIVAPMRARDMNLIHPSMTRAAWLLPTESSRARLHELLQGVHDSSDANPWILMPRCVLQAAE